MFYVPVSAFFGVDDVTFDVEAIDVAVTHTT